MRTILDKLLKEYGQDAESIKNGSRIHRLGFLQNDQELLAYWKLIDHKYMLRTYFK